MVGKNGSLSSAAMDKRGWGCREIFKIGKKTTTKIFNLFSIIHAVLRLIKLKYIKLCGYNEHNEYSVSAERTA